MHSVTGKSLEYAIEKAISEVSKARSHKSEIKGLGGPQCLTQLPKAGQDMVKEQMRLHILFILTKIWHLQVVENKPKETQRYHSTSLDRFHHLTLDNFVLEKLLVILASSYII